MLGGFSLIDQVKKIFDTYENKAFKNIGMGFFDLQTNKSCYVNEHVQFPAASTFKIPVLIEFFNQYEQGAFSLEDKVTIHKDMLSVGSSLISLLKPDTTWSLYNLAMLMMITSDNTATDIIVNLLSKKAINATIEKMGLTNTRVDLTCKELIYTCYNFPVDTPRKIYLVVSSGEKKYNEVDFSLSKDAGWPDKNIFIDMSYPNNVSTPSDMVSMFKAIWKNEILSYESCQEIIKIMAMCQTNSRIPLYLPKKREYPITVIHKTGTLDKSVNDSGIISTKDFSYILSLFYNGSVAPKEEYENNNGGLVGSNMLAEISREIYKVMENAYC